MNIIEAHFYEDETGFHGPFITRLDALRAEYLDKKQLTNDELEEWFLIEKRSESVNEKIRNLYTEPIYT